MKVRTHEIKNRKNITLMSSLNICTTSSWIGKGGGRRINNPPLHPRPLSHRVQTFIDDVSITLLASLFPSWYQTEDWYEQRGKQWKDVRDGFGYMGDDEPPPPPLPPPFPTFRKMVVQGKSLWIGCPHREVTKSR
jgi:hypothetical protein